MHECIHACLQAWLYACVAICIYACVYACVQIYDTHTYSHNGTGRRASGEERARKKKMKRHSPHRKGLVKLKEVHVADLHASHCQSFGQGKRGRRCEVNGRLLSVGKAHDFRKRREAEVVGLACLCVCVGGLTCMYARVCLCLHVCLYVCKCIQINTYSNIK